MRMINNCMHRDLSRLRFASAAAGLFSREGNQMPSSQDRRETHSDAGHNWALVLAAGEGSRLQSLTMTASGVAVPKQFCSLGGDQSLLQELVHLRCRRAGFATSVRGALSGSHRGNAGRRHRERRLPSRSPRRVVRATAGAGFLARYPATLAVTVASAVRSPVRLERPRYSPPGRCGRRSRQRTASRPGGRVARRMGLCRSRCTPSADGGNGRAAA